METLARVAKLGIIGGTFNPVHFGHLRAVEEVYEILRLDQLVFVTAARPPHKSPTPLIEFDHRSAMVKLAVQDRPGFVVSDLEGERTGPSYTVDTLLHYRRRYGQELSQVFFIAGLDAFLEIHSWKNFKHLLQLASLVVMTRPGSDPRGLKTYIENYISPEIRWRPDSGTFTGPGMKPIHYIPVTGYDISSTHIRKRIAEGRSIRYLTPESVRRYISSHDLYHEDFRPEKRSDAYDKHGCRP